MAKTPLMQPFSPPRKGAMEPTMPLVAEALAPRVTRAAERTHSPLLQAMERRVGTAPLVEPQPIAEDLPDTAQRAHGMRLDGVELTPLMRAAATSTGIVVVQDLLARGADPNGQNPLGWTALMVAAAHDNPLAVYTLLQAGADVRLQDDAGETARDKAATAGNTWVVRLLAKAESQGSVRAIAEMPFPYPTKVMPEAVERKTLMPPKDPNHSLLTSFALKSAGRMPKPYREPGPLMTEFTRWT